MPEDRVLSYGSPLPASWLAALQEFIATAATNFHLSIAPTPDRVQVVAGAVTGQWSSGQVGLGIDGLFRYITATTSQAITGVAGTKDIFAVTGPNNFVANPGGTPPEIDSTNYAFSLQVLAHGATPTPSPTLTNWRKVGELDWDGAKVTGFRPLVGELDTQPSTVIAPTPNIVPSRQIGAVGQAAALETWEAGGLVVAQIDPAGRLQSPSVPPIGSILPYAGTGDPPGGSWLIADGRLLPNRTTTYAAFFAVAQHTYNHGTDPLGNQVRIPDKRGRHSIGAINMGSAAGAAPNDNAHYQGARGAEGGEVNHTLVATGGAGNELPAHSHGVNLYTSYVTTDHYHSVSASGSGSVDAAYGNPTYVPANTASAFSGYSPGASSSGGNFPRSGTVPGNTNLYHGHTFSVSVGGGSNWQSQTHNLIDGTSTDPNHRHATNGSSDASAAGGGHNNIPPIQADSYIVRVL